MMMLDFEKGDDGKSVLTNRRLDYKRGFFSIEDGVARKGRSSKRSDK